MAFNQSYIEYGYMILTSGRDDEVLVIWTSFVFFRPILIDCINISKFKNTDMRRCECTGWGLRGWEWSGGGTSVFLWETFLVFIIFILF